jgi:hypothetical protein
MKNEIGSIENHNQILLTYLEKRGVKKVDLDIIKLHLMMLELRIEIKTIIKEMKKTGKSWKKQ